MLDTVPVPEMNASTVSDAVAEVLKHFHRLAHTDFEPDELAVAAIATKFPMQLPDCDEMLATRQSATLELFRQGHQQHSIPSPLDVETASKLQGHAFSEQVKQQLESAFSEQVKHQLESKCNPALQVVRASVFV